MIITPVKTNWDQTQCAEVSMEMLGYFCILAACLNTDTIFRGEGDASFLSCIIHL